MGLPVLMAEAFLYRRPAERSARLRQSKKHYACALFFPFLQNFSIHSPGNKGTQVSNLASLRVERRIVQSYKGKKRQETIKTCPP